MTDYNLTEEKVSAITEILTMNEDDALNEEETKIGQNLVQQTTVNESTELKKPICVYVKVNEDGYITNVGSDIFISNLDGWVKIDEGFGDKFAHAQSHYFDKPLVDENGNYLIKYEQ